MRANLPPSWRIAVEWLEWLVLLTGGATLAAAAAALVYLKAVGAATTLLGLWR